MEWKTGNPNTEGRYLVTVQTAMMVDSKYGAHSYCSEVELAVFEDGEWDTDGVVAWAEMPMPY